MDTPSHHLVPHQPLTLDQGIAAWLDAKSRHSGSAQTMRAYSTVIVSFRAALHAACLDLDSDATLIAVLAQGWAGQGEKGRAVSASTFNQRLSILSSFYTYAIPRGIVKSNPIALVERRKRQIQHAALPMEAEEVADLLARIDRSTVEGQRDYTLLSIALTTSRRAAELAGLRWGDIRLKPTTAVLTFRCKGNETMTDELPPKTTACLLSYLHAIYGAELGHLASNAPIWISLSHNNHNGAISTQAIADICLARIGTSKVHTLRHTFAIGMDDAGAPLSAISRRLGHKNIKTTSIYLERLRSARNPYASRLEELFGIE